MSAHTVWQAAPVAWARGNQPGGRDQPQQQTLSEPHQLLGLLLLAARKLVLQVLSSSFVLLHLLLQAQQTHTGAMNSNKDLDDQRCYFF